MFHFPKSDMKTYSAMEAFQDVTQCCYSFLSNNNGNNELIMGRFRLLLPSSLCLLIHVLIAYNVKRLLIM